MYLTKQLHQKQRDFWNKTNSLANINGGKEEALTSWSRKLSYNAIPGGIKRPKW